MTKVIIDRHIPYLYDRVAARCEALMLDPSEITSESVDPADALIVRTRTKCNRELLKGSNVKLVGTATIGYDHIDREWCAEAGIETINAAGCNAPAVAQYVVSTLSRAGFDPKTHKLGIIGKGHIGSIIVEIVRTAGGTVLVCDPPRHEEGYMDERYRSLGYLAENCDALTFHVPLSKAGKHPTYHLLGAEEIKRLKPDAIVVNASRGGVIDENAALEYSSPNQKWIIDTWEGEPSINRNFLRKAFIATPHIAGYSEEGKERATRRMIEALNHRFGLNIDTTGLAEYDFDPRVHEWKAIVDSFDPSEEMNKLRDKPELFESQRDSYIFRQEP